MDFFMGPPYIDPFCQAAISQSIRSEFWEFPKTRFLGWNLAKPQSCWDVFSKSYQIIWSNQKTHQSETSSIWRCPKMRCIMSIPPNHPNFHGILIGFSITNHPKPLGYPHDDGNQGHLRVTCWAKRGWSFPPPGLHLLHPQEMVMFCQLQNPQEIGSKVMRIKWGWIAKTIGFSTSSLSPELLINLWLCTGWWF